PLGLMNHIKSCAGSLRTLEEVRPKTEESMRTFKAACLALASLVLAAAGANAEPLKIRMGYVQLPGHLGPILFQDFAPLRAVMKHYGKSYVVDPIRFRGT